MTGPNREPAGAANPFFSDDEQFWYETLRLIGAADYGGALFGEIMATASTIVAGDYDSWHSAWHGLAERVRFEAEDQLSRQHVVSARDSFLRAANYYRSSEFFLHANPEDMRVREAYDRTVACYKAAGALFDPPIKQVEIPYEKTTLPGYLHRVAEDDIRRPTLLMMPGFDGTAEELHFQGARAAIERGYQVLTFDGPGQFGPIHREGLPFRPDWERVVGPVVDFALTLEGTDPDRVVLYGSSFGGELAPRAAAYERRLAALICDDGLYDYSTATMKDVPPSERPRFEERLRADEDRELDRMLEKQMADSPTMRWAVTQGMYTMAAPTPRAFGAKMLDYNLRGVAELIECPTLVCDAEDDLFFKGQPQELYEHLKCQKTLLEFTTAEGAGAHCEIGASRLAYGRILDWLDETLERASASARESDGQQGCVHERGADR